MHGGVGYFQQQPHAKLGESSGSPSNTLNQSKIMLQHLTQSTPATVIGKLDTIIGEGGKVFISPANFAGTKRIILNLRTAAGQQGNVYCSPAVSKLLREKKMSSGQLRGMPVIESTTNKDADGKTTVIYTVTLPGVELVELPLGDLKEWQVESLPLEELVAL